MITCKRIANNNTFHPRVENRTSVYRNRFFFQGREYDYPIQLYHFRARWYDPETGRWLSTDPIGISGGLNLYAFCANNPVCFVDPRGYYYNKISGPSRCYIEYTTRSFVTRSVMIYSVTEFSNFFKQIQKSKDVIINMTLTAHGSSDGGMITLGKESECFVGEFDEPVDDNPLLLGKENLRMLFEGSFSNDANILLNVCYGAKTAEFFNRIGEELGLNLTVTGYTGKVYCTDKGGGFFFLPGTQQQTY